MTAAWMIYATGVTAASAIAALALDRLFRAHRLPVRWLWAGGMLLAVALPVAGLLLEPVGRTLAGVVASYLGAPGPSGAPGTVALLEPLIVTVERHAFLTFFARIDPLLLFLWAVASAVLIAWWALALLRARRLAREGSSRRLRSIPVVVTSEAGPAVVGVWRSRILVPRWLADGDPVQLEMALLHEKEHAAARDSLVIALSFLLVAALPWNPALWWMRRRLREAVEVDCDGRVLRARPSALPRYAETLLRVSGRGAALAGTAAALSEPPSLLERRIRTMTADSPRHPVARGLVLGSAAILALALACSAPAPTDSPAGTEEADPAPPATITGQTVPAPPQGRAGDTDSGQIRSGSDGDRNPEASDGDRARTPEAVPTPAPEPPASGSPQESDGETARDLRELASEPTFTPYTVAPDLSNRIEVAQAFQEEYPPLLRDAGIGGSILVWFLIDEEGRVRNTLIRESSGQAALDQAALRVAERMRFTPARNGDETVPVWISLPITFRVN